MMKSNLVICKTPRENGTSNILTKAASELPSAQFEVHFRFCVSLEEVAERLEWLDFRGYHLTNDRGWVFRSKRLAEVVKELAGKAAEGNIIAEYETRLLTRTGDLRSHVVNLIREGRYGKIDDAV